VQSKCHRWAHLRADLKSDAGREIEAVGRWVCGGHGVGESLEALVEHVASSRYDTWTWGFHRGYTGLAPVAVWKYEVWKEKSERE
jgi:hypothetical protein